MNQAIYLLLLCLSNDPSVCPQAIAEARRYPELAVYVEQYEALAHDPETRRKLK